MDHMGIVERLMKLYPDYVHNFYWAWQDKNQVKMILDAGSNLYIHIDSPDINKGCIHYGYKIFQTMDAYEACMELRDGVLNIAGDNSGLSGGPYQADLWEECTMDNPIIPKPIYQALCAVHGKDHIDKIKKTVNFREIIEKNTTLPFVSMEKL